jgi:hypothetical protein
MGTVPDDLVAIALVAEFDRRAANPKSNVIRLGDRLTGDRRFAQANQRCLRTRPKIVLHALD